MVQLSQTKKNIRYETMQVLVVYEVVKSAMQSFVCGKKDAYVIYE